MSDRIRILLIDDEAPFLLRASAQVYPDLDDDADGFDVPCVDNDPVRDRDSRPNIGEFFDVKWVATAEEAREFRDLSALLATADPTRLGQDGWVPELVIFDYALSFLEKAVVERRIPPKLLGDISPLPALRQLAKYSYLEIQETGPRPDVSIPGHDNFGCYAGGLIATLFRDHPCAAVAHTTHGKEKTAGEEASFFEWMLSTDFRGTFERKSRADGTWNQLLFEGVVSLRDRITELARGRVIDPNLDDVLAFIGGAKRKTIGIRSRYGLRELPIEGLFIDVPSRDRPVAVELWAKELIETVLDEAPPSPVDSLSDLIHGRGLADKLWTAYLDESWVRSRLQLSELVRDLQGGVRDKETLSPDDEALIRLFEVDIEKALKRGTRRKCKGMEIRAEGYSNRSKRWAVLFVTLQTLHRRWKATKKVARTLDDWRPGLSPAQILGEVTKDDVYLALYPVPELPIVLPWHAGKDPTTSWGIPHRDLDEFSFNLSDLLAGELELLPGEQTMLRWFASGLYGDEGWGMDMTAGKILGRVE